MEVAEDKGFWDSITEIVMMADVLKLYCQSILSNYEEKIREVMDRQWDAIIIDDSFNPCGLVMAHLTKAPLILYSNVFLMDFNGCGSYYSNG